MSDVEPSTPLFLLPGVTSRDYHLLLPAEWEVVLAKARAALDAGDSKEVHRLADAICITYHGLKKRVFAGRTAVSKQGPEARLTATVEDRLAAHVRWQTEMGDPLSLAQLVKLAEQLAEVLEVTVGGRAWRNCFKRRYNLSFRRPQRLEAARMRSLTTARASHFYKLLAATCAEWRCDPTKLWNADETGLEVGNARPPKVVCPKGTRSLSAVAKDDRRHVSAMVCANAAGDVMKTMLLYPKSFKKCEKEAAGWEDAVMRFGDSAYMDDDAWVAWTKMFVKETGGNCVLVLDQHKTRYNMQGLAILADAKVALLTLPAHTTHALQPLDVAPWRCSAPSRLQSTSTSRRLAARTWSSAR